MYISNSKRIAMMVIAVGIVLAAAFLLINRPGTGVPTGFAAVSVVGEFDDADLISPSGEAKSLRTEERILVPVGEIARHAVHVKGEKTWMDIIVTSYDGEARWVFAVEDSTGWNFRAGNTAITSYHWD